MNARTVAGWVEQLDIEIRNLTLRRDALATALGTFDDDTTNQQIDRGGVVASPAPPSVVRPKTAPRPSASKPDRVDMVEVARVFMTAVAADKPPIAALCERFGVPSSTARNWPERCRKLGLIPPRGEAVARAGQPDAPIQFVNHNGQR